MTRNNAEKKYCWDFSHLFRNDDEWKATLQEYVACYQDIIGLQKKLHLPESLKKYLFLSETADILESKLEQYLHYGDLNTTDERFINLTALMNNELFKLQNELAFISSELKEIGLKKIMEIVGNDPELKRFEYNFQSFFNNVKYLLPETQEKLLSMVSKTRISSYQLYDILAYADKEKVFLNYNGTNTELTETLATKIAQTSDPKTDQELRITSSQLLNQHLIVKKHSLAKVYETIIQYEVEEVKLRGYENPLQASLSKDRVEPQMYLKLLEIGKEAVHLYQRFIKIKKKYFKLEKFYATDSQLLMSQKTQKHYQVEDGISLIKKACAGLGPEYLEMLDQALLPGRIDYFEDTNKRSGAYSSSGSGTEPIILMNWDQSMRAVSTLAHELGHSVHSLFSNKYQPLNLAQYPIILAEVASTFNEHLLFSYLYQNATAKAEQIYLLETRISDLMATFFRQIQFAKFELEAHNLVMTEKPLNATILADLFKNIAIEYGYSVFDEFDDKTLRYSWSRILHFFNAPFYVYKYATSLVVSFKLFSDYQQGNKDNILNFIKAGGHKEPMAILKDVDVDLNQKATYQPLIEHFVTLLDKLEQLLAD